MERLIVLGTGMRQRERVPGSIGKRRVLYASGIGQGEISLCIWHS